MIGMTGRLAIQVLRKAGLTLQQVAGGVGVGMDATHLADAFGFLGGMVYATPPRARRRAASPIDLSAFQHGEAIP